MAEGHPPHDHDEAFDPQAYRPSARARRRVLAGFVVCLVLLTGSGILPRWLRQRNAAADEQHQRDNPPVVAVVKPVRGRVEALDLPGTMSPFQETIVFARVSGYLQKYRVDIGDRVKKGQVIAVIETPDLDQQINQAGAQVALSKASLEEAKSKLELARITNSRYSALVPDKYVSQQSGDEAKAKLDVEVAAYRAAEASLQSAEANAQHLRELKNFATLVAPFDGVITSRTTEEGQLVTVGMAGAQEIFKVARTDVMRMFVNVPQLYVPSVRTGLEAIVKVREFPQRQFKGKITRTTRELDNSTRTLITQIDLPNPDDALVAGMYAHASLPVARADAPLVVPSTALVFDAGGTRVALVVGGKIHWEVVQVDGDTGSTIAIAAGLREADDVVVTPSDRLTEGMQVVGREVVRPTEHQPDLKEHVEGHPVDAAH